MPSSTPSDTAARGRAAERPAEIPAAGWKDVAVRVTAEVRDDHMVLAAAGVAFFAFLAIIPALAALVSIAGLVLSPDTAVERIDDLFSGLPTDARDLLASQLETMAGRSSGSLGLGVAVGVALSLWSASSGVAHLVEGVNVAYDEHDHHNFFVKRGLALALTLGAVVFVVFAVAGIAALPAILDSLGLPSWLRSVLQFVFWPVLVAGFAAGLAIVYRYGPDRDEPRWRWVSWGSVIAVVLWIVASIAFRLYTANFGSYGESYGSLAAVVVLMLWLFITSFVVLLGAQINAEMEHQTARDTTQGAPEPIGERGATVADTVGRSADGTKPLDHQRHTDGGATPVPPEEVTNASHTT